MACTWRIRHKLMLGMGLVVAIMALLLGGTLNGLASYRAAMGTCDSKLEEMRHAETVKEEVRKLRLPPPERNHQAQYIHEQIPKVEKSLQDYDTELKETIARGRAPNEGRQEQDLVEILRKDLKDLTEELKKEAAEVNSGNDHANIWDTRPAIRKKMDDAETHVSDLIGTITKVISTRIDITRDEARKSIVLLCITGVLAVLLMAGLLRFFYRWVAHPIRDLEQGVGRVAQGDFEHRIEIHSGDEIEDLAEAFNDMTGRLRDMYRDLAQQVNERSRQLVRSERLAGVGFLAAGVAHEINNPLASIAFCSEALEQPARPTCSQPARRCSRRSQEREIVAKYLKMIQEEAFRCKEITQKLLEFSRGGERKREPTDLAELIQGVLDMVQHLQNCKGKQIVFQPGRADHGLGQRPGDQVGRPQPGRQRPGQHGRGRHADDHAQHVEDGMAELVFTDTGCGMTPEVLENIFEPFFTRSRTGKGTGLGLSISHRIITQHGGEIEATSAGPEPGQHVHRAPAAAAAGRRAEPGKTSTRRGVPEAQRAEQSERRELISQRRVQGLSEAASDAYGSDAHRSDRIAHPRLHIDESTESTDGPVKEAGGRSWRRTRALRILFADDETLAAGVHALGAAAAGARGHRLPRRQGGRQGAGEEHASTPPSSTCACPA